MINNQNQYLPYNTDKHALNISKTGHMKKVKGIKNIDSRYNTLKT